MSAAPIIKRTRLRAVYLTDTERDLVTGALETLKGGIGDGLKRYDDNRLGLFAKSFTSRRIDEVLVLFADRSVAKPAEPESAS